LIENGMLDYLLLDNGFPKRSINKAFILRSSENIIKITRQISPGGILIVGESPSSTDL